MKEARFLAVASYALTPALSQWERETKRELIHIHYGQGAHFGAGLFREALMAADLCPNVLLDTSSSNGWMKYGDPKMTLAAVFKQALAVVGPDRLLFGTDSSFFPRGWVTDVFERQSAALDEASVAIEVREKIFGGNFDRLFPQGAGT